MRDVLTVRAGALVAAAALGLAGLAGAAPASAAPAAHGTAAGVAAPAAPRAAAPRRQAVSAPPRPRLASDERQVCPAPSRPGQMECMSVIRTLARSGPAAAAATAAAVAYGPASLRSAYNLASASARNGSGATIAIVDAFRDPDAASNLASYRRHFGLRPCTTSSHCLRILNQNGKASPLPKANVNWAVEESLDLDMVSAICPRCRILLVEAKSTATVNLGHAEDAAVAKGARFVSNSWSGGEFTGQDADNHYFNHPGVAIAFASGDFGYAPSYPSDTQYVTSVGGTTLRHKRSGKRAWTETAWGSASAGAEGTGSGCSTLEAKPSWQSADNTAAGCRNRTQNDVAADANPATGAAIFDTYRTGGSWLQVGGTSEATPIIAAVYALAGTPARRTYPASYPYQHASRFFDIKAGVNGACEASRRYLCHAVKGYDGPTGLGTPNGTGGFNNHGLRRVTLVDPGVQDKQAGTRVSVKITGLDGRTSARSLAYRATGLPAGLSIRSLPHSTDASISGLLPASPKSYSVKVTARDNATRQSGSTRFTIVAAASLAAAAGPAGSITLNALNGAGPSGLCLDDNGGASGARADLRQCGAASQGWQFFAVGSPGGAGQVKDGSVCLDAAGSRSGSKVTLAGCGGAAGQKWEYLAFDQLVNPASRLCLADPGGSATIGTQVDISACNFGTSQAWALPAGPVASGVASLCMNFNGSFGSPADVAACTSGSTQQWTIEPDGSIRIAPGWCLDVGQHALDGVAVAPNSCDVAESNGSQIWLNGPGGELINAFSGRCLADPGNHGAGTDLVQQDCYGQPGEIWAAS